MFERFTERARQVVVLAQVEARGLGHNYIGTEHILLALVQDQETAAGHALAGLGVGLEGVREQVRQICKPSEQLTAGQIPFTPRAKKTLELALREALALGHNYIGTEHILLGLVREEQSVAMRVLLECGATSEKIRDEVIRRLPESGDRPSAGTAATGLSVAVSAGQEMRLGGSSFTVTPDEGLRRLLMAAAGRALTDRRTEFGLADLLAAAGLEPDDA
jgi:ATP-dependent Clp protease ATP-binding subunit ClpC